MSRGGGEVWRTHYREYKVAKNSLKPTKPKVELRANRNYNYNYNYS